MSEKLIIKNFGPIKDVELDLKKVNVLIGDQSTGKSTIAKVLYILKNLSHSQGGNSQLFKSGVKVEGDDLANYKRDNFYEAFIESINGYDLQNYWNADSYIFFKNDACEITIEKFEVNFEDKSGSESVNTNLNYYIPAFREAYILLRNNYPAIITAKAKLPTALNIFGQDFNNFKNDLQYFDFNNVINVGYEYRNGNDIIKLVDGKEISFEESSSAVNSVVPMLVVFVGIVNQMSGVNQKRIYHYRNQPLISIEEPELNCFPATQKKLIDFFIEKIKKPDYENSFDYYCSLLLTTHSPYILTSLNNLMYAYTVGQKEPDEAAKIIDKKYWINPEDVSAYMLLPNGTCENIIEADEKTAMIDADRIDEISGVLNKQFDELLNLEFVPK